MGRGKEIYDERRRLEAENDLLQERAHNRRLKQQDREAELLETIAGGLAAFFQGDAELTIRPAGKGFTVRFGRAALQETDDG